MKRLKDRTIVKSGFIEVRRGWVILTGHNQRWGDDLFPSKDAAVATASLCLGGSYSIAPAKTVWNIRRLKHLEWIIGEAAA